MTLQDKYTAVLEGKYSKEQFKKDAVHELPQFLTKFNSFDDTVTILKNKSILQEVYKLKGLDFEKSETINEELTKYKEEKGSTYEPAVDNPEDAFSFEEIQRGLDYELEAAGFDSALPNTFTEEDVKKAYKKVMSNLEKNRLHYLNLLAGESNETSKHDKLEALRKDNHVDTYNGMKKANLREDIDYTLDPYEDRDKILKQVMSLLVKEKGASREELKGFISTHMEDILNAPDEAAIVDEFEQYISVNTDYVDEIEEIGMFHDPRGYKKSEPNPKDLIFTKKFVGTSDTPGHSGYIYDIYKNGVKIKTIEGEGNANAYINKLQRELNEEAPGKADMIASAIQKAMNKEEQLKEAVKNLIIKTLDNTPEASVKGGLLRESHYIHPEAFEYYHGLTLIKAEEAMVRAAKLIARDLEKEVPAESDEIRNFILTLLDKHLQNKL